jgi:hypothetical protein
MTRRLKNGLSCTADKESPSGLSTPCAFFLPLVSRGQSWDSSIGVEPEAKEVKRLAKARIFWRTLKNFPGYALFLKLASLGLDVGFTVPGHSFGVEQELV